MYNLVLLEPMQVLTQKSLGELLQTWEAQLNVFAVMRNMVRFKEVIPNAERNPEIDPVGLVFRHLMRMMPDVHLRIVENILQWP